VSTSNPAFSRELFAGFDQSYGATRSTVMTVQGTVAKTFLLLAILSATALWSWNAMAENQLAPGILMVSAIGGFVVAMITIFKPNLAPWTAPAYAALEGVFLGAISQIYERSIPPDSPYHGIALQAVTLTCGVLFVMLFLYSTRIIRVTDKLRAGIVAVTGALCLFYFVSFLLGMFGVHIPFLGISGTLPGIAFSLFVVGLAAFNLLLDFDFIEKAAHYQAPKTMEWYGAFGLMVTLIWLYLEILRLLRNLADQRN
jgi:uncharacterized YccA/Bax inhibitor family protein